MQPALPAIDLQGYPKLRTIDYLSPFRYPGGKAFLTGYLSSIADYVAGSSIVHYLEPYCGGAGAAFGLLASGKTNHIHLNDADIRIYSAWRAILTENQRFLDALSATPVTMDTWYECQDIISNPEPSYSFEVGFSTYFINRTSRSGIVLGSGPIGGYDQTGSWKLNARYYLDTMRRRIEWIGMNASYVSLSNLDGIEFLRENSTTLKDEATLYLIDPPYVKVGNRMQAG